MQILFSILILLACFLLGLVIMIQNPKGGGLSASLGGSMGTSQMFGVEQTGHFLEKATWVLSVLILIFIFLFNYFSKL